VAHAREHLADFRARLYRSIERRIESSGTALAALDAHLHSLSPLAVLDRGYALVLSVDGSLIRSIAQITSGDRLTTRLADGSFMSRVESIGNQNSAPRKRGKKPKS
jgi:exodeoxyribonuclease VII large subunit